MEIKPSTRSSTSAAWALDPNAVRTENTQPCFIAQIDALDNLAESERSHYLALKAQLEEFNQGPLTLPEMADEQVVAILA